MPRFTIRSLLVVMTTIAAALAAARALTTEGGYFAFALYATLMAATVLMLSLRFAWHYAIPAAPEPHAA